MATKYLPVESNGCKHCVFRGHNGGLARYEDKRICCDAPYIQHRPWTHPDWVTEGDSPDWCPLVESPP